MILSVVKVPAGIDTLIDGECSIVSEMTCWGLTLTCLTEIEDTYMTVTKLTAVASCNMTFRHNGTASRIVIPHQSTYITYMVQAHYTDSLT